MTLRARVVKLVDTADLKSAAFVNSGRAGSIPASGTTVYMRVTRGCKQNSYTSKIVAQSLHTACYDTILCIQALCLLFTQAFAVYKCR